MTCRGTNCDQSLGTVAEAVPAVVANPKRGSCAWIDPSSLADQELMPGFRHIKQLLASPKDQLFFAEICEELSIQ